MSAKHALLGLLLHRPAYPYELADRLEARLGPAWAINSGQLTQTIRRMEEAGLIERVDETVDRPRDRCVRAITEQGVREYERWFGEELPGARLTRRPLLIKLALGGPEQLRDGLAQLDEYELACAVRLEGISKLIDEAPMDGLQVRADSVLLRLSLSADVFQLEGELGWARHARETISWLLRRDAIWLSTQGRGSTSAETQELQNARAELFGRMKARDSDAPLGFGEPNTAADPLVSKNRNTRRQSA